MGCLGCLIGLALCLTPIVTGATTEYDDLFKQYQRQYTPDVDWRWYRSQAWAESRFRPDAVSPVGATGMMQIMPGTWNEVAPKVPGALQHTRRDARWSIAVGIRYMATMRYHWLDWQEPHRHYLAMGSYNAGYGYWRKALQLAKAEGQSYDTYESIAQYMPQVPRVKWQEPLTYVKRIVQHYPSPDAKGTRHTDRPLVRSVGVPTPIVQTVPTTTALDTAEAAAKVVEEVVKDAVPTLRLLDIVSMGGINMAYAMAGIILSLMAVYAGWNVLDRVLPFDTPEELQRNNAAVGIVVGFTLLGLCIVVGNIIAHTLG